MTWRIQGTRGGENGLDPTRGPLNTGGLFGERAGWSLPGFPDASWSPVSLPTSKARAGVTWYRTTTTLALPKGQDTSIALHIADDPARHYRAEIYVNGWQLGNYINDVGPRAHVPDPRRHPQHARDQHHRHRRVGHRRHHRRPGEGVAGEPRLATRRRCRSQRSPSPGYTAAKYALPAAATADGTAGRAGHRHRGAARSPSRHAEVPAGAPAATSVVPKLTAPAGWTVSAALTGGDRVGARRRVECYGDLAGHGARRRSRRRTRSSSRSRASRPATRCRPPTNASSGRRRRHRSSRTARSR